MRTWLLLVLLSLTLGLASCGKSIEAVVKEQRGTAEAKIARILEAARLVRPPAEVTDIPRSELTAHFGEQKDAHSNGLCLVIAGLSDGAAIKDTPEGMVHSTLLDKVRAWVSRGMFPGDKYKIGEFPDQVREGLDCLLRLRFVLFVERVRYVPGKMISHDEYLPGDWEGTAQLVDLETLTLIGGFPVQARSAGSIRIHGDEDAANRQKNVDADLDLAIVRAVKSAWEERMPKGTSAQGIGGF